MFRAFYVHHQEDYTEQANLHVMFSTRLCKQLVGSVVNITLCKTFMWFKYIIRTTQIHTHK